MEATLTHHGKWVKTWEVPSSDGDKTYRVSIDEQGNYGCSCPSWKFRREECKHILLAKSGFADEVKQMDKDQKAEALLRSYAEKGYRYENWYGDYPLHPWDRRSIENLKKCKGNGIIEDVRTFRAETDKLGGHAIRIVVIKETEQAYTNAFDRFIEKLKRTNLHRKWNRSIHPMADEEHKIHYTKNDLEQVKAELAMDWFNLVQYIVFNKTHCINPNLGPMVYNSGKWGKRLQNVKKHFKFLRH